MKIKVKKLSATAKLPTRGSEGAGAWDIYADQVTTSYSGARVYTGLSIEVPPGYMLCLVPRSSISKYDWRLSNSFGIVDSDYRGEVQFVFSAVPTDIDIEEAALLDISGDLMYTEFPYKVGDRIGQAFLLPVINTEWEEVDNLSETDRGDGGFGSTGK